MVCDFTFLTSSGGRKFYKFFMTVALAVPPLTVKNRHVCLFGHVRLNGRIRYLKLYIYVAYQIQKHILIKLTINLVINAGFLFDLILIRWKKLSCEMYDHYLKSTNTAFL